MGHLSKPLKAQMVYLLLRDQIITGAFGAGERLPGEAALTEQYQVSRVTVRRALEGLVNDNLVEKRAGAGTFVRDRGPKMRAAIADVSNVFSHLKEMGRETDVRMVDFGYIEPDPLVREALGLESDERVQRSVRVRLVDGAPFSHLTAQVPERIGRLYSRDDMARGPLLELLERSGLKARSASQEISASLAGPEIAELLDMDVGSPLIALTRVVFGGQGEGLQYLEARYRPDRYSLHMDLVRTGGRGARYWSADNRKWSSKPARASRADRKKPARASRTNRKKKVT